MADFLDGIEMAEIGGFSRWQTICAWVFKKMTGMKIAMLYRREK